MKFEKNRSGVSPRTGAVRPQVASPTIESRSIAPRSLRRTGRGSTGRRLMTAFLVVGLLGAPGAGFAEGAAKETSREGGLGAAAALSTLVYGPVKLLYATGGLIVGSFAWAFTAGDSEVAEKVFTRSLRGTYVITPDHLTGEQELVFIGRQVDEPAMRTETVASAAGATAATSEPIDESGYDEMGW